MLAIDHAIVLVDDLDTAAAWLLDTHGLASVAGGRHPGHGTANRIVPLGPAYVELMTVVDGAEAATSPMGRWATTLIGPTPRPAALCLRTEDADAVAARLGVGPVAMSRTRPDGTSLAWRLVGASDLFAGDTAVFFIEWDDPSAHPGTVPADHRVEPTGDMSVVVRGDRAEMDRRIGDHHLPLAVEDGPAGLVEISIGTTDRPIILR